MPIVSTEPILNPLSQSDLSKKGLCDWVINVASGCLHGCTFCYVPSTPAIRTRQKHLQAQGVANPQLDWGNYLFLRENLGNRLRAVLQSKRSWRETPAGKGVVLLCSGTDPYQNQRARNLTRTAAEILLEFDKRIRILTRSPLWIKDLDLLCHPNITVGMSIPHSNDQLSRQIEPHAPRPSDRLKAMEKGKAAGCRLFIAMAPTPPPEVYDRKEWRSHLAKLLKLEPEVIFWEPINNRSSAGQRMAAAGLNWPRQTRESFMQQWKTLSEISTELGCEDLIHYWPDQIVASEAIATPWFYKPSREQWN